MTSTASGRHHSRRSGTSSHRHRSSSVSSNPRSSSAGTGQSGSPTSIAASGTQRERPSAKVTPMHDDSDAGRVIPAVRPALAIDYLGNSWSNEDDIAASWKFMTKQKNDLINGLRLENASWRNWAKQRHNLKTVNPRTLNWLKDSDTTWLYGPLYKASIDEFDMARFGAQTIPGGTKRPASPTEEAIDGNTKSICGLKPALKHKTASELFKADTLFHVQSDLKLDRKIEPKSKAQESLVIKQHRQPILRFNDSVEQCVSVDTEADEGEGDGDDVLVDEEDEEDAGILMRISSRRPRPARSIVRINPTRLKAESMHGMEVDESTATDITTPTLPSSTAAATASGASVSFAGSRTAFVKSPHRDKNEDDDEDGEDATIADVAYSHPSQAQGAERSPGGGGGLGQKAADLVNNVKDIVHWASSLVYNSSAF